MSFFSCHSQKFLQLSGIMNPLFLPPPLLMGSSWKVPLENFSAVMQLCEEPIQCSLDLDERSRPVVQPSWPLGSPAGPVAGQGAPAASVSEPLLPRAQVTQLPITPVQMLPFPNPSFPYILGLYSNLLGHKSSKCFESPILQQIITE